MERFFCCKLPPMEMSPVGRWNCQIHSVCGNSSCSYSRLVVTFQDHNLQTRFFSAFIFHQGSSTCKLTITFRANLVIRGAETGSGRGLFPLLA